MQGCSTSPMNIPLPIRPTNPTSPLFNRPAATAAPGHSPLPHRQTVSSPASPTIEEDRVSFILPPQGDQTSSGKLPTHEDARIAHAFTEALRIQQTDDGEASTTHDGTGFNTAKRYKREWNQKFVGSFWPDVPAFYGAGRIVYRPGDGCLFRDVHTFTNCIANWIATYGADTVARNLPSCFRGAAVAWWNNIADQYIKNACIRDNSGTCAIWIQTLQEKFRLPVGEAMANFSCRDSCFTVEQFMSGASLMYWFTDMLSLVTDAYPNSDDNSKLRAAHFKLDPELQKCLPTVQADRSISSHLLALQNVEEGLRDALIAQDNRLRGGRNPNSPCPGPYQGPARTPNCWPFGGSEVVENQASQAPARESQPKLRRVGTRKNRQGERQPQQSVREPDTRRFPQSISWLGWTPTNTARRPCTAAPAERLQPLRPCLHCGKNHFDSMCMRILTPRLFCTEVSGQPVHLVPDTGDAVYDAHHQYFVDTFFAENEGGFAEFFYYSLCEDRKNCFGGVLE